MILGVVTPLDAGNPPPRIDENQPSVKIRNTCEKKKRGKRCKSHAARFSPVFVESPFARVCDALSVPKVFVSRPASFGRHRQTPFFFFPATDTNAASIREENSRQAIAFGSSLPLGGVHAGSHRYFVPTFTFETTRRPWHDRVVFPSSRIDMPFLFFSALLFVRPTKDEPRGV